MKTERRALTRVNLRLPILILRPGLQEPLRSETTDINNGGFHFTTPVPFNPGEKVNCFIRLPGHGHDILKDELFINCDAEVVRVVARVEIHGFGIGCRITHYRIIPTRAVQENLRN